MTAPHDRITTSPQYAHAYHRLIAEGATPEDAARRAYEWVKAQPPPKKNHTATVVLLTVLGVVAFCGISATVAIMMSPDTKQGTAASSPDRSSPERGAPSNRDGNFEFAVLEFRCGVDIPGATPQGQFCTAKVSARNVKKDPKLFSSGSQRALGADGTKYNADTTAGLYANPNGETFLNEINPGNSVTGVLVFDVPSSSSITALELHDSPFSQGVRISVP